MKETTDNVEATKRANVEGLNKTALAHFMKESKDEGLKKWIDLYNTGVWEEEEEETVDLCNSCGRELKEEDGEFLGDYEFCNDLNVQCVNLCKECRDKLEEPPEILKIRDIPYEQVKKELAEYYDNLKDGEVAYPSDVSLILKLDLEQTMKAVDELIEEGRMEVEEEE